MESEDWREVYAERYFVTKSKYEASRVSPYSYMEILDMLSPGHKSYDPYLASLVKNVEERIVDRAEQILYLSIEEEASPKNRAWIAKEILRSRAPKRWGESVRVNISVERAPIAQLAAQQSEFLLAASSAKDRQPAELPGETIDAEVVDPESEHSR